MRAADAVLVPAIPAGRILIGMPVGVALGLAGLGPAFLTLNLSLLTPPAGACLFVLASVSGERIERIAAHL